jgi:hypothetical protein
LVGTPLDTAILDSDALAPEPLHLLLAVASGQLAVGAHYAPPGQSVRPGHDVANRSGRSRVAGSPRHFAVAGDLAAPQIPDHRPHGFDECQPWLRCHP